MRTRIQSVDVVTLDGAGTIHRGVDLVIADGLIESIGDVANASIDAAVAPVDEVVDGRNHVALPAFWNAHCHAAMTFERGWAEDLPLDRWFNERIWVAESALTSDDVYWGAALAACELLRGGCIGFNDHYFYMDRVADVVTQAGMKAGLAWCQFGGSAPEVGTDLDGALRFALDHRDGADGRIHTFLGPHSPYICPPPFLRRVADLAHSHALPLHIHAAESAEQVARSQQQYGRSPIAHLDDCGLFADAAQRPCVVAHALCLSDADVAILAARRVRVAHCPITYMKLAMPMAGGDPARLLAAGVDVALGTDGPGSNNDMDMKAVVRCAPLLQKYHARDAQALAGDLPLRMATQAGARALGFAQSGVLSVGRPADLILIDLDQPHLYPRHDLVANLVHAARGGDVTHVFVDGRMLMRKRQIMTLDVEKIQAEADARAGRMVRQNLHLLRQYAG